MKAVQTYRQISAMRMDTDMLTTTTNANGRTGPRKWYTISYNDNEENGIHPLDASHTRQGNYHREGDTPSQMLIEPN